MSFSPFTVFLLALVVLCTTCHALPHHLRSVLARNQGRSADAPHEEDPFAWLESAGHLANKQPFRFEEVRSNQKNGCDDKTDAASSLAAITDVGSEKPWEVDGTAGPMKVWKSPKFAAKFKTLVSDQQAPDLGKTFGEVFDIFKAASCRVYPHGGAVRDVVLGLAPKDIDVVFMCDMNKRKEIAKANNWHVDAATGDYIRIGKMVSGNEFEPLEGVGPRPQTLANTVAGVIQRENTVNSLAFDPYNGLVLDADGTGFADICASKVSIAQVIKDQRKVDDWARVPWYMSLRWFKLKAAPKSLATSEEDDRLIFNYILSKWEPKPHVKEANLKGRFLKFMCDKIGRGTVAADKCSAATAGYNKIQAYIAAQKATYERIKGSSTKYDTMWGEMEAMHAKVVKDDSVAPVQGADGYSSF